jgi:hypothetical protein
MFENKIEKAEAFFLSILKELTVSKVPEHLGDFKFNDSSGYGLLYYHKNTDYLYVNYDYIWYILQNDYGLSNPEIRYTIRIMISKHLKWDITGVEAIQHSYHFKFRKYEIKWKSDNNKKYPLVTMLGL